MKNPPPHCTHDTHPAIGVMGNTNTIFFWLGGNTNTITLENKTNEYIDIIELRGIIPGKTVKAHGHTDIDPKEYDGDDCRGGQLPILMIFCGGSLLRSPKGAFLLPGDDFFSTCYETVTIVYQPVDQNSTGVVNYEVKFQPRDATFTVDSLKFSRDPVLDHENGWSVQCINGSVKLTHKEGKPMTLDPSELFSIVRNPETSLFCKAILMFWPETVTYLKGKNDLEKTVGVMNDLMVQAKKYNVDRSKGAVANVMKNVDVLNELCAAKVEWYRPLFPWMEKEFPPVAEVDQEKLKMFAITIAPLLNSLLGRSS